jgi:hypothetical protein
MYHHSSTHLDSIIIDIERPSSSTSAAVLTSPKYYQHPFFILSPANIPIKLLLFQKQMLACQTSGV